MPRRFAKRRGFRMGSRFRKRRRVGVGRRYRRRSGKARTRVFRRFRRRFKKRVNRRFGRRRRVFGARKRQDKLRFTLAETRMCNQVFGQQHTVPNALNDPECIYFTTEASDPTHTAREETITDVLGGIRDVLSIADQVWQNTPRNWQATDNAGWASDLLWGRLAMKGRDTYKLRNQSNEPVRLTAYYCRARKDYKLVQGTGSNTLNVYDYLATGFAERGIVPTSTTANSQALTIDELTPFQSHAFCRQYKITRVEQIAIRPGNTIVRSIKLAWRMYQPVHYTVNNASTTGTNWGSRQRMFTSVKGERFILFKLHGGLGGVSGQTVLEKDVGQTTPTVIMETFRRYRVKHLPLPAVPTIDFTVAGHQTATASIIVDADEQKGAEIDAS